VPLLKVSNALLFFIVTPALWCALPPSTRLLSVNPGVPEGHHDAIDAVEAAIDLQTILEKMEAYRRRMAECVEIYAVDRAYRVENKRAGKQAELRALMIFVAPGEKLFGVLSYSGSGFLRRSVLNRLIETERQSARIEARAKMAVTPENYAFELLRRESLKGRPQYLLRARPRQKRLPLFDGVIWVDAEDFAITRVEGRPAKNPSFWTRKTEFVHEYAKFDAFWFPVRNTSVSSVLLFGHTTVEVEYVDYRINQPGLRPLAAEIRKNGDQLEIQIDPKDKKAPQF
jgi:hypothetical protein